MVFRVRGKKASRSVVLEGCSEACRTERNASCLTWLSSACYGVFVVESSTI